MNSLVSETVTVNWRYIAEGGSAIVFSYVGPVHPLFTNKVLRLRKIAVKPATIDVPAPAPRRGDLDDPVIAFQEVAIRRLVPDEFLPHVQVVKVDKAWVQLLAEAAEASRPEARRVEDRVDTDRETAVLADNLIGGSGCAVEIKPKWGFLPCPDLFSPTTRSIKTRTCRFCMHARMKGAAEKDVPSDFCPLDLYSGNESRVRVALRALWDAWVRTEGGINNLRIFANGRVLKPASDSLLAPATEVMPDPSLDTLRTQFCDALLPFLLNTPVLRLLSFRQRTLDPLDIEGLSAFWGRIHSDDESDPPLGFSEAEPTPEEWTRFIDKYLVVCDTCVGVKAEPEPNKAELRYHCLAYLLSATFKDCSLMIRMGNRAGTVSLDGGAGDPVDADQQDPHTRAIAPSEVKLIDLDIKSIKRLAKWEKLDREIATAHAQVEAPRTCVDSLAGIRISP
ncbi:inositol-pentakisphosphate 2-kinase [Fomitopsis serialis]|uniref:inositol-pentakisphosphate 2-kinase n=1 Tax=Fomitopsis serialis TaxID=139415 RepID=UPI00200774D7|nr:inositol-pentakisphosphate 2-kinase [Neoantrodia serialis]KAH9928197.1 inositol-pentakisphosphate 2-kinase [Neoantrodia serialis]